MRTTSKVSLYGLPNRSSADWTVVVTGPEGLLAILADAKVSAGQDHNTLLFVLAHNTQLVLTLTFHLNKDDIFISQKL